MYTKCASSLVSTIKFSQHSQVQQLCIVHETKIRPEEGKQTAVLYVCIVYVCTHIRKYVYKYISCIVIIHVYDTQCRGVSGFSCPRINHLAFSRSSFLPCRGALGFTVLGIQRSLVLCIVSWIYIHFIYIDYGYMYYGLLITDYGYVHAVCFVVLI